MLGKKKSDEFYKNFSFWSKREKRRLKRIKDKEKDTNKSTNRFEKLLFSTGFHNPINKLYIEYV